MTITIITLFPESFQSVFQVSIVKRAQIKGKVTINFLNPRDFTHDKHRTVDDKPYGGGAGMIMKPEPIIAALESISNKRGPRLPAVGEALASQPRNEEREDHGLRPWESISPKPYTLLLSAGGKKYNQKLAQKLSYKKNLAIICGHYEGVDARIEKYVDETISIGDFILTGGEIGAMVIIDSIIRLIPNVISKESLKTESFLKDPNFIEYPQFTRPENFRGHKVPRVLLSGDHQKIDKWRNLQSHKQKE